ncbi:MAG: NADH:ubiquinone reductase (Na(+)-transporting) subunit F, partial [Planctomycetes bacterium]|nr:NADH:ubiquinone reductase (Na(+)-transporting) subunit F [Planctomycetota bacterium]
MSDILLGVSMFTGLIMALIAVILLARSKLVPVGNAHIVVNEQKTLEVPMGGKLLGALAEGGVFVSSACGGGGTCGQCKVEITSGGGEILPTELGCITKREARAGMRLSCQVPVKGDLSVAVPAEAFTSKKWLCRVRTNRNVATFIKELVLELPAGEEVAFKAGGFIQIEAPPHRVSYRDFAVEEKYRDDWDRFDLWSLESVVDEPVIRAYSMANYPGEKGIIMLNVRVATPPPGAPEGTPPGQMSSFIFNLRPGDEVTISGPFGEFFIQDTESEMVYVG